MKKRFVSTGQLLYSMISRTGTDCAMYDRRVECGWKSPKIRTDGCAGTVFMNSAGFACTT